MQIPRVDVTALLPKRFPIFKRIRAWGGFTPSLTTSAAPIITKYNGPAGQTTFKVSDVGSQNALGGNGIGATVATDLLQIHPALVAGHLYAGALQLNVDTPWNNNPTILWGITDSLVGGKLTAGTATPKIPTNSQADGSNYTSIGGWAFTSEAVGSNALGAGFQSYMLDSLGALTYVYISPLWYISTKTNDLLRPPTTKTYYLAPFNTTGSALNKPTGSLTVDSVKFILIDYGQVF